MVFSLRFGRSYCRGSAVRQRRPLSSPRGTHLAAAARTRAWPSRHRRLRNASRTRRAHRRRTGCRRTSRRRARRAHFAQCDRICGSDVRLLVGGSRRRAGQCEAACAGARVHPRRQRRALGLRRCRMAGGDRRGRRRCACARAGRPARRSRVHATPGRAARDAPAIATAGDPAWLFYTSGTTDGRRESSSPTATWAR